MKMKTLDLSVWRQNYFANADKVGWKQRKAWIRQRRNSKRK